MSISKCARVKWFLAALAFVFAVVFGLAGSARAQDNAASKDNIEVLQVRPNVYMIAGAGANIAVQTGDDGVVLVDAGSAMYSDRVVEEIKKVSKQPIRFIIDTNADPDHVGGNEAVSKAGTPIGNGGGGFATTAGGAAIIAHDEVLDRMSVAVNGKPLYPTNALPSATFSHSVKSIYLNGEAIQVLYQPAAHSDGDSMVFFRRSDVLATGDVFNMDSFPVIEVDKGGSIQGELDALNRIVDMAVTQLPLVWEQGGTMIIPGHGRLSNQPDAFEYRDMITIIRDIVKDDISKGQTLDQIKASNPTIEYRQRYGSDTGPWTTDMFVEAVYRSLTNQQSKAQPAPAPTPASKTAKKATSTKKVDQK